MNSTSLYVTTNQIILKSNPNNPNTWQDLYRLIPYLRNSLCCVVCGNLLVDPLTPAVARCQHHVCRKCVGGRKKIKPTCTWCKDCTNYSDNKHLQILLQCYKKMCIALVKCGIYNGLLEQASKNQSTTNGVGVERGAANLISLIKEGAAFQDEYESKGGLPKSTYSILPCIYTNSSTQTLKLGNINGTRTCINPLSKNQTSMYSVMFAGTGNKITIKRKSRENIESKSKTSPIKRDANTEKLLFKKPLLKCSTKPKKGCRCGNATLTPGKLTCCGQRCPCYVENKACIECKCRGCRNPHRPDGNKVRPLLPQTQMQQVQYQLVQNGGQELIPYLDRGSFNMDSTFSFHEYNSESLTSYDEIDEDETISSEDSEIIVDV